MSEALWYYEEAGRQAGPVSHGALAEAVRTGRLPAGSRVWRAGLAGWLPWEAVPELAALAPPPPVGGPPPLGAPPAPSGASSPGGLARLEVATTVVLCVVTFGVYGFVKFHQCGQGYARLAPGRASTFEKLFWWYVGLIPLSLVANLALPGLGLLFSLADLVVGILLLGEVLEARDAAIAATGARVTLTSSGTHKLLWIGGVVLSVILVGLFALLAQAVLFFSDHDKLAEALSRR